MKKIKILTTFVESGMGHISSMEAICNALNETYGSDIELTKSFIMVEDNNKSLIGMEKFMTKQVQNTNKIPYFGRFIFSIIHLLGGHHLLRFFHRYLCRRSFKAGLAAIDKYKPDVVVTNHYFTNLLAVEYKKRHPETVIINYNPDNTLHSFWDNRDGVFIVNNDCALKKAIKYKFKQDNLRLVAPCVRKNVEECALTKQECRQRFHLPEDRFTVTLADGAYMMGRAGRYTKSLLKTDKPITVCLIAGKNDAKRKKFLKLKEKLEAKGSPVRFEVYPFLRDAYVLYGASDIFITKGGPNAVLDSLYMDTPVYINYCPQLMEAATLKFYVKKLKCGDSAKTPGHMRRTVERLCEDSAELGVYHENIAELLARGNGADQIADIIMIEAGKGNTKITPDKTERKRRRKSERESSYVSML